MIYLLCALPFSAAIVLDRNPPLNQASRKVVAAVLDSLRDKVVRPAVQIAHAGVAHIVAAVSVPEKPAPAARPVSTALAPKPAPIVIPAPRPLTAPEPTLAAPSAPPATVPDLRIADEYGPAPRTVKVTPPPKLALAPPLRPTIVPPPAAPSAAASSLAPAELARVTMRLRDSLTREMLDNFGLFLYVSKADVGPWSQRLYVFRKDAGGNLAMLYNWPASTGREKDEIAPNGTHQPSLTPEGYYQIDPKRMYRNHFSGQWREPMPYAMFFNWENQGLETGLAIHGATGLELKQLGTRASAGCIRIAPENAALLFKLIKDQYKGLAPRFAYDRRTATMSNQGVMMHDAAGNLQMADGYKVLVFVENFGGENVVAALF
ncbi:MAG: L,D-transpeptidase family protein [Alphaproteobacteria bacterium]|nr:L,D-transpeptidase family protein [Alphaproteobacteria bacterium]MBL7099425.1 L,D-transpeptidase family protein [Alphaproteobacteria bacterium]